LSYFLLRPVFTYFLNDQNSQFNPSAVYLSMMNIVNPTASPLQKIAHHLLSVTANSASCEHLFSAFGLVLTQLRSHLSVQNMTNLAELQLHLCDENFWSGTARQNLWKWKFTTTPTPAPLSDDTSSNSSSTVYSHLMHQSTQNSNGQDNGLAFSQPEDPDMLNLQGINILQDIVAGL
jgi:hypothetical protein